MLLAAAAALAIVSQDPVALRAAPSRSAPQQAQLWPGEMLEVRRERLDYLQVWDYRRERGGYVPAVSVRVIELDAAQAPDLLATARFLRDTPGQEALGIAYVAAYLKAAPVEAIGAEPFATLGTMADRLAARISSGTAKAGDPKLAAQLETVRAYGVAFDTFEREDRMQLCYDGDAFSRVLGLAATPVQRAEAALGLTRPECVDPTLGPTETHALQAWQAKTLDSVALGELPLLLKNRIRMRRAGLWAALAFADTRDDRPGLEAGARALDELASVVDAELTASDRVAYTEAAVRVGASRWAAELPSGPAPVGAASAATVWITTHARAPGETCVKLLDATHDPSKPLAERCTWGTVWAASATPDKAGTALALAVQPLASWRELWLFRKHKDGWSVSVLPPAASDPDIGYAEFAGWVPNKRRLLVAREARVAGRWQRSFELVSLDSLAVINKAGEPEHLSVFHRWQSPAWKQLTVSLR